MTTTVLHAPVPVRTAARRTGPSLPALAVLEIRKSLSTRSGRSVAAIAALIGPAGMVMAGLSGSGTVPAATALGLVGMLTGLVLLALGVLSTAGEWSHRSVQTTFLLVPQRGRVLAAKVTAMALLGLALAGLGTGAAAGVLAVMPDPVNWASAGRAAVVAIAAGAAFAVTGAGIGAAVGNSPAALTGTYIAVLAVLPIVQQTKPAIAEKLDPATAVVMLADQDWSWTPALVIAGWVVVSTAAGALLTRRRAVS
jgi:ABC-2 type transport system permease protein